MRKIVCVELNHQNAPLAVREKLSFAGSDHISLALQHLKSLADEVFMINTCNRFSVYAYTDDVEPIIASFCQYENVRAYLTVHDDTPSAAKHLLSTASGLESQALGEHEILGQIKSAHALARKADTLGAVTDELLRHAIFVGKKVREETAIGQEPVSLASVSYDVIKKSIPDFGQLKALVIGTGEMANLVLKILSKKNPGKLYVASKTYSRAEAMQHIFGCQPVGIEKIKDLLPEVNVIIGATHTEEYLLTKDSFTPGSAGKLLVDLGLPRNFEPAINELENVKLFDLDTLKDITSKGLQRRMEEVPKAKALIAQELDEFLFWLNTRQVSPVISSYYERLEKLRNEELKWALPRLGNLDEKQQQIIEDMLSRLTRRLSGKPIEKLRHYSQEPALEKNPIETFKELFDL